METIQGREYALSFRSKIMQKVYEKLALSPLLPSSSVHNLTISHTNRFIWFRVAKVATRTIYAHLTEQKVPLEAAHPYRVYYPVKQYEDYFKFAFVRNPWDRLVSGWHNKIVDNNTYKFDAITHRKLQNFDYFTDYLLHTDFFGRNPHFVPQCTLIDLNHLDYLGRFERFLEDFEAICAHIGITPQQVQQRNSSGRVKDYRYYYTDAQTEIVARLYQKDIQLFNYRF